MKNPTYEDVCSDETGHAEAVQVEFDPAVVPYEKLLEVFWAIHDPTQKNRQGPDEGTQYRSAIFYHTEEQKKTAEKSLKSRESADSRESRKPQVSDELEDAKHPSSLENAKRSSSEEQKRHKQKIATEITKASTFYKAEEYHQKYLAKKGKSTCGI